MSSEAITLGLANQWGPILFGIIYGLIIGSKIDSEEINRAKYPIVLISGLLIAMALGTYPEYQWTLFDHVIRISEAFISTIIGLFTMMLIRRQ
ncbi:MAG: hydrogenase subunit EhbJ [Candidatus Methanofastidiosum methylothiophilum]|jgi:hypothetical protein|uniref:Hydrogenase subunit EhbJ n=1 Tax=Candidatus Methanofastidiosum methylothiophilum TaxID=1705564 RepID=A0A150JJH7_9EURY|nr:MAG: hydrogenase subunit EhbJ [Candidatus Methanofastidiosum methylthiophilus]MBP6932217.1 hypothetical protein [Methanofastidiosum sp.]OQC52597.1 MAG: hypothetical protein BWX56_00179 [Euryarchaeota archaeon ADurb.Bin023]KYC57387.1 MAG: hydrogenase subunit EhbJ [Candidatus Methanofastidiosum methylthiophilus]KYC58173.1 MAG: hydrogenase subunit EhbJ [Candidatus Methanofastidiosum methylthiophilus]